MLSSTTMDYERFAELAGRHLVTPMLAGCLAAPALRRKVSGDFVRYVDVLHQQNRRRNADLRGQLAEIATHLNPIGVEPLLLKGGARLVDDLYPDLGWRFMRDLDILAPRDRLDDAVACLQGLGYRFTGEEENWSDRHRHIPPLYRDGVGAVVELHTSLLSRHHHLCPADDVLRRAAPVDLEGATVRVPARVDQLAHLIGHDLADELLRYSSTLPLRSLFETALLCHDRTAVDEVLERCGGPRVRAKVETVIGLAANLFPQPAASMPVAGFGTRLRVRRLGMIERLDERGRLRRFLWFARLRLAKLLRRPDERRYMMAQLGSLYYYRRCCQRVRRLWANG